MSRKVLYVHDGTISLTEDGKMYSLQFTEEIIQRYLLLGDSITACLRQNKITKMESEQFCEIRNPNFTLASYPSFKSLSGHFKNKLKVKKHIENLVKTHDVLVIRMPSAAGAIAVKAARKYKTPYLVEMVSCAFDALWHYDWRGKLLAYFRLKKHQNLIKDCPYVIYVTEQFLQDRYPTTGASIGCSDVELIEASQKILQKRLEKIEGRKTPLTLGTVGVLNVKYKGQADVIQALYELKNEGYNYHYKIVGQRDSTRLRELINKLKMNNEIEIIGPLPPNKINDFLMDIDLYIQPSKTEGLPRALIEAMSMACPSLGSNVGGIPELIDKDSLFKAGDIKEIKQTILSFTKSKLISKAKINYNKSLEYQKDVLEEKRTAFYYKFLRENNLKL